MSVRKQLRTKPLTVKEVASKTTVGLHSDGGSGLYLQVKSPTMRSWVFRYKLDGRSRMMGLGSVNDVSLADARAAAVAARKLARQGIDPIEQRDEERAEKAAATVRNLFKEVAETYQATHKGAWKNAKHKQQWENTLTSYVYPVMGDKPVAAVNVSHVLKVLEPIWSTKAETANRIRGRIEAIIDYAIARGWRTGDNPARWKGHLSNLLPATSRLHRITHHAALPWKEIGTFMKSLDEQPGTAAKALKFAILTAARTEEVLGATWPEIDLAEKVWTVPGQRMKGGRDHRVPLSEPAIALLTALPHRDGPLFPGRKADAGLSNMALLMTLRRMQRADLTAHGFRSTFRDWVAETTDYPSEVAEAALAHVIGDKVEAAYRRGDLFEKRRRLMNEWGVHCTTSAAKAAADNATPAA